MKKLSKKATSKNKAVNAKAASTANSKLRRECETVLEGLRHPRGEAYTAGENRAALVVFFNLLKENVGADVKSTAQIISRTACMLGRGERTLQDVIRLYEEKGEIAESDDANRGRGSAKWVYGPRGFSNIVIAAMKQRMAEALSSKDTVRAGWMCEWLANEFNLSVSRRVLYRVMKRLIGANWGKCVTLKDNFNPNTPEAKCRRRDFLVEYAAAKEEEAKGTAVIAHTDETYLHTGHSAAYSWSCPEMKLSSPSKGRRLIILHAMTRHGWVTTRGPDGAPLKLSKAESSDLKTVRLTAEMVYEANASLGDYHDNMDSATFISWLRMRFFPTMRHNHPGKRFFLVLDNAKVHKAREGLNGAKWQSFSAMKKADIIALLTTWGVKSVNVLRVPKNGVATRVDIAEPNWHARPPKGPSKDELVGVCKRRKADNPEYFLTKSQKLFREMSLEDSNGLDPNFHRMVFTPPYEGFEVQATEPAWGISKGYVSRHPSPKSKIADLMDLFREGLYGFTGTVNWKVGRGAKLKRYSRSIKHAPVDCAALVSRCEEFMNGWIAADDRLKGTIDALSNPDANAQLLSIQFGEDSDDESSEEEEDDKNERASAPVDGGTDSDGEAEGDLSDAPNDFFVRCDDRKCRKWRILDHPHPANAAFRCSDIIVAPGIRLSCSHECDGCESHPCECSRDLT